MKTTLFGAIKALAGVSLNLGTAGYGLYANKKFEETLKTLPAEKLAQMRKRDYDLRNNNWYNSESPYLRTMAIAAYDQQISKLKMK
jgi:hypothetical protein